MDKVIEAISHRQKRGAMLSHSHSGRDMYSESPADDHQR
jgi:hypothetical protein